MAVSNQDALNLANPNSLADLLRLVLVGDLLAGMVPREIVRTGLTSSATHVEPEAGKIDMVLNASNATLALVGASDTAGAGEVQVTYDSEGVATLVFGDGANTAYTVTKTVLPAGLGTTLAAETGAL